MDMHFEQTERRNIFNLFLRHIKSMFSVAPVINNIIALMLAVFALYFIYYRIDVHYQNFFAVVIEIFAAIQIIKSGAKSLLLPVLAVAIGGMVSHSLGQNQMFLHFAKHFYVYLMITGIIGIGVAILNIE